MFNIYLEFYCIFDSFDWEVNQFIYFFIFLRLEERLADDQVQY